MTSRDYRLIKDAIEYDNSMASSLLYKFETQVNKKFDKLVYLEEDADKMLETRSTTSTRANVHLNPNWQQNQLENLRRKEKIIDDKMQTIRSQPDMYTPIEIMQQRKMFQKMLKY
jgi:hypothetical protein